MRFPFKEVKLGHKINMLTVIDTTPIKVRLPTGSMYTKYKVRCDCGKETTVVKHNLFNSHVKSCGCHRYVERTKPISYSPSFKLFTDYRTRAKKKGLTFELDFDQFIELTSQNCYYCDLEPIQRRNAENKINYYLYNGIDRKDNSLGYTLENSLPCCKFCNGAKTTRTQTEFYSWIAKVAAVLKDKNNV